MKPPQDDVDIMVTINDVPGSVNAVAVVIPCILSLCILVLVYTIFQFKNKAGPQPVTYYKQPVQEWCEQPRAPSLSTQSGWPGPSSPGSGGSLATAHRDSRALGQGSRSWKWWHWPGLNMGQGVMAAVPRVPWRPAASLLSGVTAPYSRNRPGPSQEAGPMPGGGPVVTAPVVHGAPRRCTWLDPAPSVGSQHSPRPIWEMPPVLVPPCQHLLVSCPPPHPHCPPRLQDPLPADTVGSKPGFPWALVTADPSGNLLHTSGSPLRVTCCRQGCGPAGSDKDPAVTS